MENFETNAVRHLNYMLTRAPVLYFRTDKKGRILEANKFAEQTVTSLGAKSLLQDVFLDFDSNFDLADKTLFSGEHLLSISTRSGYPESYLFSFEPVGNEILVFGHINSDDVDLMQKQMRQLNQELGNTARQLHKKNAQLEAALAHIKTLQGIIPICSFCHKIRKDEHSWDRLETYLSEHTDAQFSHGICPDCMATHYPEYDEPQG